MGRKKRLKEMHKEIKHIRRENLKVEVEYEIKNVDLDQPEEFEETSKILKLLMPIFLSFSCKNVKLWEIKIEGLLGSID